MSGREFFTARYKNLGWKYKKVNLRQAIRINAANVEKPSNLVERLHERKVEFEKIPFAKHGYWISETEFSLGATSEYLLGLYSIQEAAAQIPVTLFEDLEHKTVLDACAAPGGKTTQLADTMHNTGVIVALDIDQQRLTALSNHLERCRATNTVVYALDARNISQLGMHYDRVLLDMPCSGNFSTDKEWFMRRTIRDVERNAALQREILSATAERLQDDGEIIYSTCSLEPEEDELNIDWAVRNLDLKVAKINCYGQDGLTEVFGRSLDSTLANSRRIWPEQTQGFYICKLRKGDFT